MRALRAFGLSILAVALAVPAVAAPSPVTGNIGVVAEVRPSCKWISAQDIQFNTYDPADANSTAPLDATGSVTLRCSKNAAYLISLGQGLYQAAGSTCLTPLRQLKAYGMSPDSYLRYEIYQDSARTKIWGCDTTNRLVVNTTSALNTFDVTLYGRIPGGQDPESDYYMYYDTVLVTVTF